jgi:hypothetical protein
VLRVEGQRLALRCDNADPHDRTVTPPDSYRRADAAERFAADIACAVEDLCSNGIGMSCLTVDSMFSSDGIYPVPTVLDPAVDIVYRSGGVFIADEVQAGFARIRESMWGFSRHKAIPDIVTMAKPMGNGMPVAAMAASDRVLGPFATRVPYFNTYGGNPVSIAAASAVLCAPRCAGSPQTTSGGDVRGAGLYIRGRDRRRRGHDGSVLKIRPPLVFPIAMSTGSAPNSSPRWRFSEPARWARA